MRRKICGRAGPALSARAHFPSRGCARGRGRRRGRPGASHGTRRTDADVTGSPSRERCQSVRTLSDDWYDGTWSLLVCSRSVGGFLDLASGSTRRVSTETAATMPRAAPPLQSLSTLQTTCCLANNVIGCCWRHVVAHPPLGFSEPDYWYAKPPRRGAYTRFPPPGAPPARRTRRRDDGRSGVNPERSARGSQVGHFCFDGMIQE